MEQRRAIRIVEEPRSSKMARHLSRALGLGLLVLGLPFTLIGLAAGGPASALPGAVASLVGYYALRRTARVVEIGDDWFTLEAPGQRIRVRRDDIAMCVRLVRPSLGRGMPLLLFVKLAPGVSRAFFVGSNPGNELRELLAAWGVRVLNDSTRPQQ